MYFCLCISDCYKWEKLWLSRLNLYIIGIDVKLLLFIVGFFSSYVCFFVFNFDMFVFLFNIFSYLG